MFEAKYGREGDFDDIEAQRLGNTVQTIYNCDRQSRQWGRQVARA